MDSEDKLQLQKKDQKKSPERIKRPPILSPLKRPPSLRLVSPFDSDQELNDLEVASVLADGYIYLILSLWSLSVLEDHEQIDDFEIAQYTQIIKY